MNYKILFTALIAGFAQLGMAQGTGKVNIKYTGKNPMAYAYLQKVADNGMRSTIDSAQVKTGSQITLKTDLTHGGDFYIVDIDHIQKNTVILETNDVLNIESDGLQNGKYAVSGSKNMDFYAKLNEITNAMKAKVVVMQKDFQEAVDKKDQTKQQAIQQQYQEANMATINAVKGMFPQMGTGLVALYATNFLDPKEELPFLQVIADKFEKTNPTNPQITTFIRKIKKMGGTSIGSPAPEIALTTPTGDSLKLSQLRGKYVLIDFWASWCGPCRRENPNVVKVYNKYKNKDFEILGVSLDRDKASWLAAIDKDKLTWKHISDLKYWQSEVVPEYSIDGIPLTYLLDKEGKIIAKNLRGESLEAKLVEIFGM